MHRLPQPQGLHGRRSWSREGAIALSGDRGIQDIRRDRSRRGLARRRAGGGRARGRSTSTRSSSAHVLGFIDAGRGRPLRVVARRRQRDGRADGRAAARAARARPVDRLYWSPTASSPTTSPTRCWRRTAGSSSRRSASEGAELGIAWDGDADRCFFIDDTGEFVDGRLPHRAAGRVDAAQASPGATILYDVRASRAVPDIVDGRGRHRARQPRRPRVLQDAHARGGRGLRRRGLGPLLLPRLLLRRLRRRSRRCSMLELLSVEGKRMSELLGRYREQVLHLRARSTPRSPTRRRRWRRSPSATPTASQPARRRLGRLRRLALQRAPVEHRAAAAPEPRVAGLAARTWSAQRDEVLALIRS